MKIRFHSIPKPILFLLPAAAGILILLAVACLKSPPPVEEKPQTRVQTAAVENVETARPVRTSGRLASRREMRLSFKIGGIIRTTAVEEGDRVREGQLLARLDPAEIESQVSQARSALAKAERDMERVEKLYQEKAATLEQMQDMKTLLDVTRAQLRAAEFNLRHAEIRAPAEGRILKRLMEENEMTGPGMPVFFLAAFDRDWVVRIGVSDRDLVRLKLGDPAEAVFDAFPGRSFPAEVSEIVEAADPMTGTFELELRLKESPERLVTGLVARVEIHPSDVRTRAVIPVDALVSADGDRGVVFTVDGEGRARRLEIRIAWLFDDRIAVESGLEEVNFVVTMGAASLADGEKVEIVPEENVRR